MNHDWTGFTPILKVKDAEASAGFYCDVLGFTQDWVHRFAEDFPAYVSISRGPLNAHISEHHGGGTEKAELFVAVPDVDEVYEEFKQNGLEAEPPESDPDINLRHFRVTDPDGHLITFATATEKAETPDEDWTE